jgi:hypothetical protein
LLEERGLTRGEKRKKEKSTGERIREKSGKIEREGMPPSCLLLREREKGRDGKEGRRKKS